LEYWSNGMLGLTDEIRQKGVKDGVHPKEDGR
jgi:hypothetical protein